MLGMKVYKKEDIDNASEYIDRLDKRLTVIQEALKKVYVSNVSEEIFNDLDDAFRMTYLMRVNLDNLKCIVDKKKY